MVALTHDTHNAGPIQCPYIYVYQNFIAQVFDSNEKTFPARMLLMSFSFFFYTIGVNLRLGHRNDSIFGMLLFQLKSNVVTLIFVHSVMHVCKDEVMSLTLESMLVQFNGSCVIKKPFWVKNMFFLKFHFQR